MFANPNPGTYASYTFYSFSIAVRKTPEKHKYKARKTKTGARKQTNYQRLSSRFEILEGQCCGWVFTA